ncbi:MAG: DEDD exonuclease domain-containing protein [Micromonosporaceae bacterium]|nr:DEDD exonuclease domain-containing protein [Micromonosporaceae bacterium]
MSDRRLNVGGVPEPPAAARPVYVQGAFDELDEPLRETTFAVFDLETTGGVADGAGITEIGAVKVRGGEVLGEFSTLVNPGVGIPPFIAVLTGITDAMVCEAPRIDSVLPSFLEFAHGAVLVAHNAPYDIGFLKAACAAHGYPWPGFRVVDTVQLARRALMRDETPNHKLSTLARHFRAATEPCHRALADARATVDVLHGLIARVGSLRVQTLPELIEFSRAVSPAQRRKRHLADGVPASSGVYVFRDGNNRALYVGTSRNLATRVRSYFTASETRARISEMLAAAERVETIECAHSLEAEVRELRLIAAQKPPYNRRSKFPERVSWLKLTVEPYPRLSLVRELRDDGATYLGPFSSRRTAELAMAAAHDAVPLRQCTQRLSTRRTSPSCVLAEMGRCPAPCELQISVDDYARHAEVFTSAATGDPAVLLDRLLERIGTLAAAQRYEEAATVRTRLVAFLRAAVRMQRLTSLTAIGELVAARPSPAGGWELSVVRRGRLVSAGASPPGAHPQPTLDALLASAETVAAGPGPTPCASVEETERILAWLEREDTRLVRADLGWAYRVSGAARWRSLLERAESAASAADPFGDRGLSA